MVGLGRSLPTKKSIGCEVAIVIAWEKKGIVAWNMFLTNSSSFPPILDGSQEGEKKGK